MPKLHRTLTIATCAALATLAGCVAPVGPVEVTRFHVPEPELTRDAIAVEPVAGADGNSLEFRSYAAAVQRQLTLAGFTEQAAGSSPLVAQVRLERRSYRQGREGSPVSVGVGGSTGSYGSGLGVGIGINLSGPPPEQVETLLSVTIRQRSTSKSLWEGRAQFTVAASSPLAGTQLGAAKLAEALFKGFPGQSGETIQVK